jgi:hypothetical protein
VSEDSPLLVSEEGLIVYAEFYSGIPYETSRYGDDDPRNAEWCKSWRYACEKRTTT